MSNDVLLDGVLTVLAERGLGALSIRNVAAAAGASAAQVQYHYRTKQELVQAGFDYAGDQFVADIAEARPTTLFDLVSQWLPLDERRERRARVWLAYAAISVNEPELAAASAELDAQLRVWFSARGLSPEVAAQLFAMIDGATVQCLMMPLEQRQAFVDRSVKPFLAGHAGELTL